MADAICVVCRHRPATIGVACKTCRDRVAGQLAELLHKMAALRTALMPTPAPASDRVSVSRIGSPVPARLDALNLTGPGSEAVTAMLHPLVRRWSTVRTVTVTFGLGGRIEQTERLITEWHQELARDADGEPIMVAPNDQIGVLPPAEWLDTWVRAWRSHFGHHVPARSRTVRGVAAPPRVDLVAAAASPTSSPILAHLASATAAYRRWEVNTALGMHGGDGGNHHTRYRSDDPVEEEWETRFGDAPRSQAPAADVRYLTTWLDAACEQDVGVADFAGELRSLLAELGRVLGDQPDQQWLGRCPASISDPADDEAGSRPCGAGLWQDPHATQVQCPRCHTTWGPRSVELLYLAAAIRRVWPIDRRRRYNRSEIDELQLRGLDVQPRCPTCTEPAAVQWRDVTATTDTERWWRPDRATCANGCPDADRAV